MKWMTAAMPQGRDINCDQECIGWEWWKIFSEVEEMFCFLNM